MNVAPLPSSSAPRNSPAEKHHDERLDRFQELEGLRPDRAAGNGVRGGQRGRPKHRHAVRRATSNACGLEVRPASVPGRCGGKAAPLGPYAGAFWTKPGAEVKWAKPARHGRDRLGRVVETSSARKARQSFRIVLVGPRRRLRGGEAGLPNGSQARARGFWNVCVRAASQAALSLA